MLVCYINIFRDAFWPNGKLAPHITARTDPERSDTKERAQQKLLDNIPGKYFFTRSFLPNPVLLILLSRNEIHLYGIQGECLWANFPSGINKVYICHLSTLIF